MYVLNTDTFSHLLTRRLQYPSLVARVSRESANTILITSITAQEILQGSLAHITGSSYRPSAYRLFEQLLDGIALYQRLAYTEEAEHIDRSLPNTIRRIGPQDCRIAAIARVNGFTVITRNLQDFEKINLVPVEDWSCM